MKISFSVHCEIIKKNKMLDKKNLIKKLFFSLDTPVVKLKMGSSLNPDDIKEGDDVYFECHILSNPKPYKMAWYHEVSTGFNVFFIQAGFFFLIPV